MCSMASLIFLALAGFIISLPRCEPHVLSETVAEGEEPARLQKRGAPSNVITRPPPPVFQWPQPEKKHENSKVFPLSGDTKVFVHVQQPHQPAEPPPRPAQPLPTPAQPPARPAQPPPRPAQPPPRPAHPPHKPAQHPWAGNLKTHAPSAPIGNQPNTQGTGRGCSCREKSCPSHPCRQGGVLEVVKIKTWQNKPKSPARKECSCWDRNCPSHPCKKVAVSPHQRPMAEPAWD